MSTKTFETEVKRLDKVNDWICDISSFSCSVFLNPQWLKSIENKNQIPVYFNFIKRDEIIGKISGLQIRGSQIKGDLLFFYSGVALKRIDANLYDDCLDALYQYAQKYKYSRIIIGSYDQPHSLRPHSRKFHINERMEYVIPLNQPLSFSKRFKRNLGKSRQLSPECTHIKTSDTASQMHNLLHGTTAFRKAKMRGKYKPLYLPHWYYSSLPKLYNSRTCDSIQVKIGKQVHCSFLNLCFNGRVFNLLRGSDQKGYQYSLQAFADEYMIEHYRSIKADQINLGGLPDGTDGKNMAIYKKSAGATEIKVYGVTTNYITFPLKLINPLLNLGRKLPNNKLIKYIKNKL